MKTQTIETMKFVHEQKKAGKSWTEIHDLATRDFGYTAKKASLVCAYHAWSKQGKAKKVARKNTLEKTLAQAINSQKTPEAFVNTVAGCGASGVEALFTQAVNTRVNSEISKFVGALEAAIASYRETASV